MGLRFAAAAWLLAATAFAHNTYRDQRLSLDGAWKFELRRDNPLTTAGEVRFGPLRASSQSLLLSVQGDRHPLRWNTSVPWPLAGTLLGAGPQAWGQQQIWKPHPQQKGPVWWEVDLGNTQTVTSVVVNWASKERPGIIAETAVKRGEWAKWKDATASGADGTTILSGKPVEAHWLRLTFADRHFCTGAIQVLTKARNSEVSRPWQPRVQRKWFDDLVRYDAGEFPSPEFDDSKWAEIQVPGTWEQQRFSPPTWWQPDETVGHYRRKFTAPEQWRSRRVRLRFDGANNAAEVWLNGTRLGYHESGFTSFEYDVTPHLRFGQQNTIAVRVSKWSLTHEYDTDDAWYLGGLWRSVSLYALPGDRIEDYRVETTFDPQYRDGFLTAAVTVRTENARSRPAKVEGELVDAAGRIVARPAVSATLAGAGPQVLTVAAQIASPHKWTAETPYLYTLRLRLSVDGRTAHEFQAPVGFRQVEIRGNRFLLNGVALKFRGVVTTRTNPNDSGEPIEKVFAREIRLLKEANVNAIRSHTSQLEDEFLDLCDRHGIYIIPDVPNVWVNEHDFQPLSDGVVQRAQEIYERHKNRPSVIAWHVGNENGLTTAYRGGGKAARWLSEHDKSRPVAVCQNRADSEIGTSFTDMHYRPLTRREFTEDAGVPVVFGEFHAVPENVERLKDLGFVESWGRSFDLEWAEFMKRPWSAGGFICCWDDGSVNGDLGACQWGLTDSKRQPKPLLAYVGKTFAPVRVRVQGGQMEIENRLDFSDLSGFRFQWSNAKQTGEWRYKVAPHTTSRFSLQASMPLRIKVIDDQGYTINEDQFPPQSLPASVPAALPLTVDVHDGALQVRGAAGQTVITISGISLRQGERITQPLKALAVRPFDRSLRAEVASELISGDIRAALQGNELYVTYELQARKSVALSEIALTAHINEHAPVQIATSAVESSTGAQLAATVSRRNVQWLQAGPLRIRSASGAFHVRGETGGVLMLCSFLGAGDFLGKFDRETIQLQLKAGEKIEGEFVMRIVE